MKRKSRQRGGIEPDSGIRGKRMSNYYVSGCVSDGESVSTCDEDVAQFWTLYHRNDGGLSEGIIDCMFREDAEAAMRVYEQRDALAAENAALKAHPAISLCSLTHVCEEIAAQLRAGKDGE